MKFKKAYFLLIMSLFLLVSIGSVCAEDIGADVDLQSTDGPSVDILANGTGDFGDDPIQEPINTTVDTVDSAEFEYYADKNISLTVKDNESAEINVNESDLQVIEGDKLLNFTYNNSILSIKDKLSIGNHSIIISYLGNATYANSTKTIQLFILGNRTLEAPETVYVETDGAFEIKAVKVFDGVKYIELNENDFTIKLNYFDDEGNLISTYMDSFTYEGEAIRFFYDDRIVESIILNCTSAANTRTIAVKYGTYVVASDDKIKVTDDKNITVHIYDILNNELTVNDYDLLVQENGKNIVFDYNNSVITVKNLAVGVHTLNIVYIGNDTYIPGNKTIIIKVWGNQTINPDKIAKIDADNFASIFLNLTDGADPVNVDLESLTVTLYYTVGNTTYNRTISDIILEDDNQTILFAVNNNFDSAYVDIQYAAENNLTARTVLKVDTFVVINLESMEIGAGNNFTIGVVIYPVNGTVINSTLNNTKILFNGKEVKFIYSNYSEPMSYFTITEEFTYGVYNLTVKYIGNDTYYESAKSFILTVYGINVTSTAEINSTKLGNITMNIVNGNETVNITKNDLTLNVTYKDGNDTKVINITEYYIHNGTLIFTLENANFTSAILNIKYNNTEVNVTLNRKYNVNVTVINNEAEYQSGNFTYQFIDIDTNEPLANKTIKLTYSVKYSSITFQNSIEEKTDENGIVVFNNSKIFVSYFNLALLVGNNTVTLAGNNLRITNSSQKVVVSKATINIKIDDYSEYYGSDKKVKITITNAKTGDPLKGSIFHLYMPQTSGKDYYLQTNENGIIEINVNKLVGGKYNITLNNNDTENINNASAAKTITILQIPVKIAITSSLSINYNSGNTATIKITDKATGKAMAGVYVIVQLDSKTYLFQTDSKGKISFAASLAVGKHKITVNTADNRYKGNAVKKTITVKKATATIKAPKVTDYYKGVKYFTVKLINSKTKKAMYDAKLNIKVYITNNKYYNYNGRTGANGQIKLVLSTLKPGTYKVVVAGADSKSFTAKEVTSQIVIKKAPTKLIPKKLTAKKGAKSYFKVTVKNKKTKKVIAGVKVKIKVYTGKKAKTYTAKSNAKGIAKISTSKLKVGSHKVLVTSANKYCVAKQAKSTIKITK